MLLLVDNKETTAVVVSSLLDDVDVKDEKLPILSSSW
jgi:hypothetical protein